MRQARPPPRTKKVSMMSTDSEFDGVVHNTVTTLVPETTQDDEDDIYSNERKQFSTKVRRFLQSYYCSIFINAMYIYLIYFHTGPDLMVIPDS